MPSAQRMAQRASSISAEAPRGGVRRAAAGTVRFLVRSLEMDRIAKLWPALAVVLATTSGAFAQAPSAGPNGCANARGGSTDQNLSDKLRGSAGVICPPNVDPGMKAPTPRTGDTPVIPAPGTPGSNPNVKPKQ